MADIHPADGAAIREPTPKTAFPITRLFYSLGFALLAWLAFWALLLLSAVQFVVLLITGRVNAELKTFNLSLLQ